MEKEIKFHSIYYRYFIFILMFALSTFYVITYHEVGNDMVEVSLGEFKISMSPYQYTYRGFVALIVISIFLHFAIWKFSVGKSGIYIKKINITVPWEDVDAVAHVWINEASRGHSNKLFLYNRKSLVIYRKNMKPICIYNISLLSIFLIKLMRPQIRSNILIASTATLLNILLNAEVLYVGLVKRYDIKNIEILIIFIVAYAIKTLIVPLVLTARQNAINGKVLTHDGIPERDRTKAIKI